jgi:hypothetical protein
VASAFGDDDAWPRSETGRPNAMFTAIIALNKSNESAGVHYMPKPWQPLNVLITAEEALASGRS